MRVVWGKEGKDVKQKLLKIKFYYSLSHFPKIQDSNLNFTGNKVFVRTCSTTNFVLVTESTSKTIFFIVTI